MLIKLLVLNSMSEGSSCAVHFRVAIRYTRRVLEHSSLTQFGTNNFISILYFNTYFKPYL